jgi:hypothetical protein
LDEITGWLLNEPVAYAKFVTEPASISACVIVWILIPVRMLPTSRPSVLKVVVPVTLSVILIFHVKLTFPELVTM